MEIIIFFQNIFTPPIEHESFNPLKHGEYLTICIHWIFEEKNVYFFLSKVLKKNRISYPFGVRQSMVGEGCDEAGVHHPERISHALRHFSFSFSLLFAANIVRANIICTINNRAVIIRAINNRAITICANTILWSSPLELSSLHPSSSQSSPSKPSWHLHQWDRRRRRWFWSDRSKQLRTQIARCGLQRCPAESGYW